MQKISHVLHERERRRSVQCPRRNKSRVKSFAIFCPIAHCNGDCLLLQRGKVRSITLTRIPTVASNACNSRIYCVYLYFLIHPDNTTYSIWHEFKYSFGDFLNYFRFPHITLLSLLKIYFFPTQSKFNKRSGTINHRSIQMLRSIAPFP